LSECASDRQTNHPAADYDDVRGVFDRIYFVLNHRRIVTLPLKPYSCGGLVLCTSYFVLCSLFLALTIPFVLNDALSEANLSTKYKVQRPKTKDQSPKSKD